MPVASGEAWRSKGGLKAELRSAVNDAETVARLTDLAEECERKLSAMADRFDGGSTD